MVAPATNNSTHSDLPDEKTCNSAQDSSCHSDLLIRTSWTDAAVALAQVDKGKADGQRTALWLRARLQAYLFALGCFLHRHAGKVLFVAVLVLATFCVALKSATIVTNVEDLWVEEGGRLEKELRYTAKALGETSGSTHELVIQTPRDPGASLLHVDALLTHLDVVQAATEVEVKLFDTDVSFFAGIICVQGDKWKETRRFITSALRSLGMVKFGPGRAKMEADVLRGVQAVVSELQRSDLARDVEPILCHALGNVLFRLVFGRTWDQDDATWKTLQHLQEEGTKLIGVSAAINFLPFLRFLPKFKKSTKFIEEGIAFTHEIYQDLLKDFEEVVAATDSQSNGPPHLMAAFVEEMRRRGEEGHFNRTQFNYLMADIFGAGVDTTLATLRWFLLFMALQPHWQERVQEELDAVTNGDALTLEHMPVTPVLEACVLETQRIRPVTPVGIPHGTTKETLLNGYRIPAGSMIIPLQWAVHMDVSAYHTPHLFDPSNFLSDGKLTKPEHFIPFQTGKRMCVGEEYARVLLFLFGGTLLKEFQVSLSDGCVVNLDGEPGITLTPSRHPLVFKTRHNWQP